MKPNSRSTANNPSAHPWTRFWAAFFVLLAMAAPFPAQSQSEPTAVSPGDIPVIDHEGDWIQVDLGFMEAWVNDDYLDIDKSIIPMDEDKEVFLSSGGGSADAGPAVAAARPGVAADDEKDLSEYEVAMRRAVDSIVAFLDTLAKRQDIGLKEKMEKAVEFIRFVRWGPDRRYYFWIVDVEGMMILEPVYPYTEGSNVLSFKDLTQKYIFAEFIRSSMENPYGHVEHYGLGYDENRANARLTVVRLFQPWEWVIGIGAVDVRVEPYEDPEFPIQDHEAASRI